MLAHRLHQTSHLISKFKTGSGITTDSLEMNQAFKEFYTLLYSFKQHSTLNDFNSLFGVINLPVLGQRKGGELEKTISAKELEMAASSLQIGKNLGPDGYPSEFYRKLWHRMSPILIEMISESFNSGCLPETLIQASISVIFKKGKDLLSSLFIPPQLLF